MLVDVKKVDPSKRELRFEVNRERVSQTLDSVYTELGKKVKVKGFRPGKVPRHVLERSHSKLAQEEVLKHLIPEVYHEGITKEELHPLDMPEIHDVEYKEGKVTFRAVLDIKPDVEISDYKGLKITRKSAEVTEDEINKTLEYFQKGQGEESATTLDDTFARGLGYPSLADFKKSIARQMELDKDRHNRADVENQLIDQLLKKAKLVAPQSLVKKQLERRIAEERKHLAERGLRGEDLANKEGELRQQLQEPVERDVKVYLVLDKIADLEKIEVGQGENLPAKVMEFLMKEAKWEESK